MRKIISCLLLLATAFSGCGGPGLRNAVNAEYWYDLGQRQYRDGRYDEAAVSLARAEALAVDNQTKALIYRDMARVYNASYNSLQEAAYMERAAEAFAMAGQTREANRALLETGQAYYNMEEYQRAEGLRCWKSARCSPMPRSAWSVWKIPTTAACGRIPCSRWKCWSG